MINSPLDNVRILEFPGVADPARGILTVIERLHIDGVTPDGEADRRPFDIKRVFYIYDVPTEGNRGGHAHTSNQEILVCLAGSFNLTLSDGRKEITHHLSDPSRGIVIPADVWTQMTDFVEGTILLVLCTEEYREEGYIHSFKTYRKYIEEKYNETGI